MAKLAGIALMLVAVWLAGCSTLNCGDSHPYMSSVTQRPLQAPPGLSVPTPDPAYAMQGLTPNQDSRPHGKAADTCLINPPQLIKPQPSAKSKPSANVSKSGPAILLPGSKQPVVKPASSNKGNTPAPAAGTVIPPPTVAAPGYME